MKKLTKPGFFLAIFTVLVTLFAFGASATKTYAVSGNDSFLQIKVLIPGDINTDGVVNRLDLLRLGKHFSGWDVEIDQDTSDVTGDGVVNRLDLLRLGKYFSGWDVVLEKSSDKGWSEIYKP